MKHYPQIQTANLRLSALIPKTGWKESDVIFPPGILLGKVCHQQRLAEISGSKSEFSLKATFSQTRFSKKGST